MHLSGAFEGSVNSRWGASGANSDRGGGGDSRLPPSHECYNRGMSEVASRELRNNTRSLLNRVEAGEEVTITVDGRPVALLRPVERRPRWLERGEFLRRVGPRQTDSGLRKDLLDLAPDSTDDLPAL